MGYCDEHLWISVYSRISLRCSITFSRSVTLNLQRQQVFDYRKGTCVGQASNPGPWTIQVRNVVSAAKHIEDFSLQCDCHAWSETSATKATQGKAVKSMRRQSGHVVFSYFSTGADMRMDARNLVRPLHRVR